MIRTTGRLLLLASTAFTPAAALATDEENCGEDIVVTGQKIAQSIQETPASVVVVTGDTLDIPGYGSVEDYLRTIPNVTFGSEGQLPTVRGVDGNGVALGGTGAVSGGRPRLTTYVDGVPRSFSFLPNGVPVTWDIAQLELYRGAQSTALGRNAVAGAIVVQTRDPVDRFEGAAQIGIRDQRTTYDGAVTLNAPLVADRIALRVSADGYSGENFVDYVGVLAPRAEFIDRDEGYRLRGKLLFRPNGFDDDLSFRLAAEHQFARRPSGYDAVTLGGPDFAQSDPFSISVFELESTLLSAEAKVPLGDDWSVYGIASYQRAKENGLPIFDDGTSLDVFANSREYAQEVRVAYAPSEGRLRATAGLFHFTRNRIEGGEPGSAFVYDATDDASTIALFADAVIPLGSFDVLAGGRWERERQDREFLAVFGLGLDVDIRQSIFLPKVGLRWNVAEDYSITLIYNKGYSPAAAAVSFASFTPYQFDRETVDTVELAWRADHGDVSVNANIFASWYDGQQLFGNGPLGPADSIVINAEETRYFGAEADISWRASPTLTVTAAIGLIDSEIVRFGGDPSNDLNNGNRLPLSPPLTARIGARWQPIDALTIDGDIRYAGSSFSTYSNAESGQILSGVVADIRIGYDFGPISLHVYAENLFDRTYLTFRDADFGLGNAGRPRTLGAAVRAQF